MSGGTQAALEATEAHRQALCTSWVLLPPTGLLFLLTFPQKFKGQRSTRAETVVGGVWTQRPGREMSGGTQAALEATESHRLAPRPGGGV